MNHNAALAFAIVAIIAALVNAAAGANHSFSAHQVMEGVREQSHLSPGDRFSVNVAENGTGTVVQALVTYKTVRELPESGDYAIVIHVERW